MSTTSIVYFFAILAVGFSQRETDGGEKTTVVVGADVPDLTQFVNRQNHQRETDGGEKTTVDADVPDLTQFVNRQNHLNNIMLEKFDNVLQQNKELAEENRRLEVHNHRLTEQIVKQRQQDVDVATMKAENNIMLEKVDKVLQQNQELVEKNRLLEVHVLQQNQELVEKSRLLEVHNQRLTEQIVKQRQQDVDVATMKAELKQLQEVCVETQSLNKRLLLMTQPQSQYGHTTAFTARIGQHHQTGLGNQQTIIFDDVISNIGNGYSPATGVFTAATNGTFFFFTSILSHYGDYLEAEIVWNGVKVVATYSKGSNAYDQGSNAAVVVLKQGDRVWVRHLGQEGTRVFGYNWSSFTGFQV